MDTRELTDKVMPMLRADPELARQFSEAMLSHDNAKIRTVFHDKAGVDLSDADLEVVLNEFGAKEQIAAFS